VKRRKYCFSITKFEAGLITVMNDSVISDETHSPVVSFEKMLKDCSYRYVEAVSHHRLLERMKQRHIVL
jgi:hypothetical protein